MLSTPRAPAVIGPSLPAPTTGLLPSAPKSLAAPAAHAATAFSLLASALEICSLLLSARIMNAEASSSPVSAACPARHSQMVGIGRAVYCPPHTLSLRARLSDRLQPRIRERGPKFQRTHLILPPSDGRPNDLVLGHRSAVAAGVLVGPARRAAACRRASRRRRFSRTARQRVGRGRSRRPGRGPTRPRRSRHFAAQAAAQRARHAPPFRAPSAQACAL